MPEQRQVLAHTCDLVLLQPATPPELCQCPAGWRDPFVLEKPTAASPWWYVMIGAGVRNKCGTALVYRSKDLTEGMALACARRSPVRTVLAPVGCPVCFAPCMSVTSLNVATGRQAP